MTRNMRTLMTIGGFFTVMISQNNVFAQTPVLGGLVEKGNYYNGTGAGYYGARYGSEEKFFGPGYGGGVGPYDFSYSGYGNGPYGAGSGSEHEFLSSNRYVPDKKSYSPEKDEAVYDGYGNNGYYSEAHPQRYNPYGFGVPKSRHADW